MLNICSNSLKYTKSGNIEVALKITTQVDGDRLHHVHLTVTDTGVGMSPEFLKYHLFTPFMQENSLIPGTGLGLSIVKSIVESMGGTIIVESRLGEGTRIAVAAPLSEDSARSPELRPDEDFLPHNKLRGLSFNLTSFASKASSTAHIVPTPKTLRRCILNICEGRFGMIHADTVGPALPNVLLLDMHGITTSDYLDVAPLLSNTTPSILSAFVVIGGTIPQIGHLPQTPTHLTSPITAKRLWAVLVAALEGTQPTKALHSPTISLLRTASPSPTPHPTMNAMPSRLPSDNCITCNKPTTPMSEEPPKPITPTPSPPTCRFKRFLLVDDNRINLKVLAAFAKRLKVPYSTAADGAEAVRLYEQAYLDETQPFDCAFMDISMPVMNGFEAVAKIRAIEQEGKGRGKGEGRSERAFILALTGLGSEGARKEAMSVGCDHFLLKPLKFKDVVPLLVGAR